MELTEQELQSIVEGCIIKHIDYLFDADLIECDTAEDLEDAKFDYIPSDRDIEEYIRFVLRSMKKKEYKKFRENKEE